MLKLALLHYHETLEEYYAGCGSDYYGEDGFEVEFFEGDDAREKLARYIAQQFMRNDRGEDQERCLYVVEDFDSLREARALGTGRGTDSIRVLNSYSPDPEKAAAGQELQSWLRGRVDQIHLELRLAARREAEEKARRQKAEREATEARRKERDEAFQRRQYEELKKKFEGKPC